MTDLERLRAIHDLAAMRLAEGKHEANTEHDLREILRLAAKAPWKHYPEGMGEESRRLHREYAALEKAQLAGAKNGADVVRLTDECTAKGIILVAGGEYL